MEADAVAFFEFHLLQPAGFFRQQLTELEIRFAQSVNLATLDSIANEAQHVCAPFVPFRFVPAHVLGQERFVFGLVRFRPLLLVFPFELILTQNGTSVAGTLTIAREPIPVTGTALGNSLTLEGSGLDTFRGIAVRLVAWSSTADKVGRMTGSFGFTTEFTRTAGSSSYSAELLTAALLP